MMPSRRQFLGSMAVPAVAAAGIPLLPSRLSASAREIADELSGWSGTPGSRRRRDFWIEVARGHRRPEPTTEQRRRSPSPRWVQEAMKRTRLSNEAPTYTMWQILEPQRETVRARLAREWGVDAEEIALTRNASEGLQILQHGFDLEPGDEVLTTTQDYGRMITTYRQRERRDGIVLKQIRIPVPAEDPAEIVRLFEEAITPRTRMILCCHMINLTGQILPVKELTALGRRHGIPVLVDGAHALAHFDFDLGELDVDFYATSLHKWLFAPHGTGLLYVRRERIPEVWPLTAAPESRDGDIRKFEETAPIPRPTTWPSEALTSTRAWAGGARRPMGPARLLGGPAAPQTGAAAHEPSRASPAARQVQIDGNRPGPSNQYCGRASIIAVRHRHEE